MVYACLPDGSILALTCPEDYILAAEIIRDEIGDVRTTGYED